MQLKTSLFNRGLLVQNLRSVGWISIAYFLLLLFSLPLQILMAASTYEDFQYHYALSSDSLFRLSEGFQIIMMFTVPILMGIFIFRYIQVKLSADYIHSLPIKRNSLYHQHVIYGFLMLFIPVLITGIILFIIGGFVDVPKLLNIVGIAKWVGLTTLFNTFVLMASVFVAMFTGISVFQGFLTYILLLFPAGIIVLFTINIKYLLHGFAHEFYLNQKIDYLMPIARVAQINYDPLTSFEMIGYILLILIFYVVGLWVYGKRKVEMATQAVAFRPLQPVFLYGVTLCAMLLGGMYFGETQGTFGWRLFGYISASIIGYYVALMILEKTWRVLTKVKGYGIFFATMAIIALMIQFDITGYERKVPALDTIEKMYFSPGVYMWDNEYYNNNRSIYKDRDNIEAIRAMHQDIISMGRYQGRYNYENVAFGYVLKNGDKIVRTYQVPQGYYGPDNERYGKLVESKEYKWNTHEVLSFDGGNIDKITIYSHRGIKDVTITDRDEINSFHQLLQKEVEHETREEVLDNRDPWGYIEYLTKNNRRIQSDWKKTYHEIDAWLEERGLLEKARITEEDFAFAIVGKNDNLHFYDYMREEETGGSFANRADVIKIESKNELKELLYESSWIDNGHYIVAYYWKNSRNSPIFETIDINKAPSFIKEKLTK